MALRIVHGNGMKKGTDFEYYDDLSNGYADIEYAMDYMYNMTSTLNRISETSDDVNILRNVDKIKKNLDVAYSNALDALNEMNEVFRYLKTEYGL